MKITQLIVSLEEIKRIFGDCEIFLSSDPEGNQYGPLDGDSLSILKKEDFALYEIQSSTDTVLIIYPGY